MLCAKCRKCEPNTGDTWCLGCTGLETLTGELAASWQTPGFRTAANDLVVSCVRGVRALRHLSASCASAEQSRAARARSGQSAAVSEGRAARSPPKERARAPTPPPPPLAVKEQEEESGESETEEEEEEYEEKKFEGAAAKSNPAKGPREPEGPPQLERRRVSDREEERHRERSRDRSRREEHTSKRKRRGSRGGSKHPRLYRTLDKPDTPVHRKPPRTFWSGSRSFAGPEPSRGRR